MYNELCKIVAEEGGKEVMTFLFDRSRADIQIIEDAIKAAEGQKTNAK
jgi:hypothetical protein